MGISTSYTFGVIRHLLNGHWRSTGVSLNHIPKRVANQDRFNSAAIEKR